MSQTTPQDAISNTAAAPLLLVWVGLACFAHPQWLLCTLATSPVTQHMACLPSRDNQVQEIAAMLDGPTIVQKGSADAITNGHSTIHCEGYGSKRRSGGQVGP